MRRCFLPAIALATTLFFIALPQLAAQNANHTDPTDHIRGVVVNSVTHEPISRALVFSPDNAFAAITDDHGRFEFNLLPTEPPPGPAFNTSGLQQNSGFQNPAYNRPNALMARKVGFVGPNYEQPNNIQAFSLLSPDQQDVVISLVPEARIVGHVNLPGSDGSNKMQVALYRRVLREGREQWDLVGNGTTRADGGFRLAELSPGFYKLLTLEQLDQDPLTFDPRGQLIGYPPLYYPNASDFATAAVIKLAPGETFQATMSPTKKRYYPVNLGVTNPVVNGMEVTVWPEGQPGPGYSLGYNPQGATIQGSMPDGTYTVQVRASGPTMMGRTNFTVNGAPVAGPAVTLLQGISVPVSVREEFQHTQTEPAMGNFAFSSGPNTIVQNIRRSNYLQVSLVPDEEYGLAFRASLRPPVDQNDESLVIENVLPGRYPVNTNTGIGYVAAITSGSTDLLQRPLIVSGGTIPAMEITVRDDGAELEGTLDSSKTNTAPPAPQGGFGGPQGIVYVVPVDGRDSRTKIAGLNPDGSFTVQQIAPGTYQVFVLESQMQIQSVTEEWLKKHEAKVQVVRLVTGQKEHLRLSLIKASE